MKISEDIKSSPVKRSATECILKSRLFNSHKNLNEKELKNAKQRYYIFHKSYRLADYNQRIWNLVQEKDGI